MPHNRQAVAPCLMNMAVLCLFWPNKLQLSRGIQQTPRLCAWSLNQGELLHNFSICMNDFHQLHFHISVNSRVLTRCFEWYLERSINTRERAKQDLKWKIDWCVPLYCARFLALQFSFYLQGCAAPFRTEGLLALENQCSELPQVLRKKMSLLLFGGFFLKWQYFPAVC